jgi:hypothetical protein
MARVPRVQARPIASLPSGSMTRSNIGASALGPRQSNYLQVPAPARKPYEAVELEAGWGTDPGLRVVGWGGPDHEYDVFIISAPVIVERADHPNQQPPSNHGSKT